MRRHSAKHMVRVNGATDILGNIDIQKTFMPGGGLAVKRGDEIVFPARKAMEYFRPEDRFASLDWHPYGHFSLASTYTEVAPGTQLTSAMVQGWGEERLAPHALFSVEAFKASLALCGGMQIAWPDHGLYGSKEAQMHPAFFKEEFGFVLVKGMDPLVDSYSAFYDNARRPTGLAEKLSRRGKTRVFLQGLALDYCVRYTAEDAILAGFKVYVILDATRVVGLPDGSVEETLASFADKDIEIIDSTWLTA